MDFEGRDSLAFSRQNLSSSLSSDFPDDGPLFPGTEPSWDQEPVDADHGLFSQYSPAVPALDAHMHSPANASSSETVSPKDLLRDSAPPSAAYTNLTTPGSEYLDSPAIAGSYETSPYEHSAQTGQDGWFSLFPEQSADASPFQGAEELVVTESPRPEPSRSRSGTSPPAPKRAPYEGVGKRRRREPLGEIKVDVHDPVAVKRARNTMAARKSRDRRARAFEELQEKYDQMKKEMEHWKAIALARSAGDIGPTM